jgi:hypothetical protein
LTNYSIEDYQFYNSYKYIYNSVKIFDIKTCG